MHSVLLLDNLGFFGVFLAVVDKAHVLIPGKARPWVPVIRPLIDAAHLVMADEPCGAGGQLGVGQVLEWNPSRERNHTRVGGRQLEHGLGCGVGPACGILPGVAGVLNLVAICIRSGCSERSVGRGQAHDDAVLVDAGVGRCDDVPGCEVGCDVLCGFWGLWCLHRVDYDEAQCLLASLVVVCGRVAAHMRPLLSSG